MATRNVSILLVLLATSFSGCSDTVVEEPWTFGEDDSAEAFGDDVVDREPEAERPEPAEEPAPEPSGETDPPPPEDCLQTELVPVTTVATRDARTRAIVVVDGGVLIRGRDEQHRENVWFHPLVGGPEPMLAPGTEWTVVDGHDRYAMVMNSGRIFLQPMFTTDYEVPVLATDVQRDPWQWSNGYRGEPVRVFGEELAAWFWRGQVWVTELPEAYDGEFVPAVAEDADYELRNPLRDGLPHVRGRRVAYAATDGDVGGVALWSDGVSEFIEAPRAESVALSESALWWNVGHEDGPGGSIYRRPFGSSEPELVHEGPCGTPVASEDGTEVAFACDVIRVFENDPASELPWPYDTIYVHDGDEVRQVVQQPGTSGFYMPVPWNGWLAYARYSTDSTRSGGGEVVVNSPDGDVFTVGSIGAGCDCDAVLPPPYIEFERGILAYSLAEPPEDTADDRGIHVGFTHFVSTCNVESECCHLQ